MWVNDAMDRDVDGGGGQIQDKPMQDLPSDRDSIDSSDADIPAPAAPPVESDSLLRHRHVAVQKSRGTVSYLAMDTPLDPSSQPPVRHHKKLAQWPATAICGNDITGSCLYVIGVSINYSGVWSPVGLLLVAFVLYLYRGIYAEVGSALPLNGASYTLLLNTTTKVVSGLAACLTLISYTATAVVSAYTAVGYVIIAFYPGMTDAEVIAATIGLLLLFAILNVIGITESSVVALIIFVVHMVTLVILEVVCLIYLIRHPSTLVHNWNATASQGVASSIFYGFGAGMLGITGFETSANFIEEQAKGVFPKTLRNMWVAVAILNPTLSFFTLCTVPVETIVNDPTVQNAALAAAGGIAGGDWLRYLVSIDACMVLAGGVLTSYVGVTGLVRRMALDRLLPQYFLAVNPWRKTNHWIIFTFLLICSSMFVILFMLYGDVALNSLSGVYTIAFLSVMTLFALGDFILKYKRRRLPREIKAVRWTLFVAAAGCLCALVANIIIAPHNLAWFACYYVVTGIVVMIMYTRARTLKLIIYMIPKSWRGCIQSLLNYTHSINHQAYIFYTSDDNIALLNKAILYVRDNEITNNIKIIHVYQQHTELLARIAHNCMLLDQIYPKMRIDFVGIKGEFTPETLDRISDAFHVPKNLMFISCPSSKFEQKVDQLGGVRIITSDQSD